MRTYDRQIAVRMTAAEYDRLRTLAAARGVSMGTLLRRGLLILDQASA
jgi:hypothetical protein